MFRVFVLVKWPALAGRVVIICDMCDAHVCDTEVCIVSRLVAAGKNATPPGFHPQDTGRTTKLPNPFASPALSDAES